MEKSSEQLNHLCYQNPNNRLFFEWSVNDERELELYAENNHPSDF